MYQFFYLIGCKPKPFKAIEDSAWRDETVEITSDLCKKFEICSESLILNLPKNMQNHVKEEISFSNCIEKNKKSNIPKSLKINVWNKYIGDEIGKTKCLVCETNFITQSNFECAHIHAESNNGQTNIDNLIPCCSICNKSMKNMNLFEFKKKFFN